MNKLLTTFILSLCAFIYGCGGASADSGNVAPNVPIPAAMDRNVAGLSINRPASSTDAYNGGLNVMRDTTGKSGGVHGHVNAALYNRTVAGANVDQFEWSHLSILDNYAVRGENVSVYAQANKFGIGPTWALVSEVTDTTGGPGAAVGHELDLFISGPDNGNRIGLDVVVGDARQTRGLGRSLNGAVGSVGIRIAPSQSMPWSSFTRGIQLLGEYKVGIDMSETKTTIPLRLSEGQSISLDANDQIRMTFVSGRVKMVNGQIPIFEIDMETGDLYKRGVKVL